MSSPNSADSPNPDKAGFITSFFNACRGPAFFRVMRKHSVKRVIGHTLLLALACSIIVVCGSSSRSKKLLQPLQQKFSAAFGNELTVTDIGIFPDRAPESRRDLSLTDDIALIYTGTGIVEPDECLQVIHRNFMTVIWSPAKLLTVVENNGSWLVNSQQLPISNDNKFKQANFFCNESELRSFLQIKPMVETAAASNPDQRKITAENLFQWFNSIINGVLGILFFFRTAILLLLEVTIMALIFYYLWHAGDKTGLTVRQYWSLAIYTAFPVTFVVSLFPALNLLGAEYHTQLFFIGWVIYLPAVLRSAAADIASSGKTN